MQYVARNENHPYQTFRDNRRDSRGELERKSLTAHISICMRRYKLTYIVGARYAFAHAHGENDASRRIATGLR